ncbi:LPXTG cell wall anchor domain-containing protein [Bifidobacterium dentium]
MPETGGMGTIVLYAAGAVLVIAAGVYFGLKKKNAR